MRNDIRCPLEFVYRGNIELHECSVKFWNYSGFVWPFYTLIVFLVIQCAYFKFELQAHAQVHQSLLKITCVSLGEFIGPMQEMGMKFKHLGSVARPITLRYFVLKFL